MSSMLATTTRASLLVFRKPSAAAAQAQLVTPVDRRRSGAHPATATPLTPTSPEHPTRARQEPHDHPGPRLGRRRSLLPDVPDPDLRSLGRRRRAARRTTPEFPHLHRTGDHGPGLSGRGGGNSDRNRLPHISPLPARAVPSRRTRRSWSGFYSLIWQDPLFNCVRIIVTYNRSVPYSGSWGPYLPGWHGPDADLQIEPILAPSGLIMGVLILWVWGQIALANWLTRTRPAWSGLHYWAAIVFFGFIVNCLLEAIIIAAGMWAIPPPSGRRPCSRGTGTTSTCCTPFSSPSPSAPRWRHVPQSPRRRRYPAHLPR
ncbi:spirocyclase, AveC family [Actinomadura sp. KC06]|nr:spirocyclase, AveC family [Actinomadura sp. KC06]